MMVITATKIAAYFIPSFRLEFSFRSGVKKARERPVHMAINLVTQIKGEILPHRSVWEVVIRQLENAKRNPAGASYDLLAAMFFAFATLEGYLNYVGGHLAPRLWENERNEKSIRSFSGKAKKVFELCSLGEPNRTLRPYSTIWDLQKLRDKIAHPMPIRFDQTIYHTDEEPTPNADYDLLGGLVSLEKTILAVEDVEEMIATIHAAARLKIDDVWFGENGLLGVLSHGEHSTTLAR